MHFIFDHTFLTMIGFVIVTGIIGKLLGPHPAIKTAMGWILGFAFFGIFVAGFAGGGILLMIQSMHQHDWKGACFSIPFILVGAAILAAMIWIVPATIKSNRIKAAHPLAPWLWDSDWVTGQIPDHSVAGAVGIWILAAFWNGISIPSSIFAMRQFFHTHDMTLLIVLLFPSIGMGFLYVAVRATTRAAVFGKSTFNIETLPASPGGSLAGTVRVGKTLHPTGPVRLHLTCTRTTGSGKNSTTMTEWEDDQQLDQLPSSTNDAVIPVYFSLPIDVPVCTTISAGSKITWQLEITAPAAEVNYCSKFKIPVFASTNPIVVPSPVAFTKAHAHAASAAPGDLRGITVTRLANGGCELDFAAGRNLGMGIVMALSGMVLSVAAVIVTRASAPLGAELIVWALAAIFDLVAFNSLFAYSKITARPHGLDVERGLLMWIRRQSIPVESVTNITMSVSGQGGNTVYYRISAVVGSKMITLASGIRGKSNAQHIVSEIEQALGMTVDATNETPVLSQF